MWAVPKSPWQGFRLRFANPWRFMEELQGVCELIKLKINIKKHNISFILIEKLKIKHLALICIYILMLSNN